MVCTLRSARPVTTKIVPTGHGPIYSLDWILKAGSPLGNGLEEGSERSTGHRKLGSYRTVESRVENWKTVRCVHGRYCLEHESPVGTSGSAVTGMTHDHATLYLAFAERCRI
jgi:hypothetical protein